MTTWIAIAIGGSLGAVSRHWVTLQMNQWLGTQFPYGTLTVNVLGSLCLGFIAGVFQHYPGLPQTLRFAVGTGFMGAFTTFSTFSTETLLLWQAGEAWRAGINILSNVVVCLTFCLLGLQLAKYV